MAAALKREGNFVQAFLIGTIAINQLLLLGACFIHGGYRDRETSYSMSMASLHISMLPIYVVLMLPSTGFGLDPEGKNLYRTAASTLIIII